MKPTDETTQSTEAAALAEQGATPAPEQPSAKKGTSKKKGAPKAKRAAKKAAAKAVKPAKPAKVAKTTTKKASKPADSIPREFSKKAIVLELLRRKDGATLTEIAKATAWQRHSIRGFISGNLIKKMGLVVESSKSEAGERVYKLK